MDREFALTVKDWIHDSLDDYLDHLNNGGKRVHAGESENNETDMIRASQLGYCAKRHGAERRGECPKPQFKKATKYKFEMANRHADVMKEALKWSLENERIRGNNVWLVTFEDHIEDATLPMSGTPDAVLGYTETSHLEAGAWKYLPVEIKRTDTKYGVTAGQLWQLCGYMKMFGSEAGFLVTMYDSESSRGTHAVWTVIRCADGWLVLNPDGVQARLDGGHFPWDDTGLFFGDDDFYKLIEEHNENYRNPDLPAPYSRPAWICGGVVLPQYYLKSWQGSKAGDLKPGTGFFYPTCPLAERCWGSTSKMPIDVNGDIIRQEDDNESIGTEAS